jgi:DNA-binding GntR family transcriptional regulator
MSPKPMAAALSLAPRAFYEEVAELLRQRIFRRELKPGGWIDGRIQEWLQEHRAIMEALARRDAKGATKRMQEHLSNGLEAAA